MKLLGPMHLTLLLLALVNMVPAVEAEASWAIFAIAVLAAAASCVYYKLAGRKCAPPVLIYLAVFSALAYLCYELFVPQAAVQVACSDDLTSTANGPSTSRTPPAKMIGRPYLLSPGNDADFIHRVMIWH